MLGDELGELPRVDKVSFHEQWQALVGEDIHNATADVREEIGVHMRVFSFEQRFHNLGQGGRDLRAGDDSIVTGALARRRIQTGRNEPG